MPFLWLYWGREEEDLASVLPIISRLYSRLHHIFTDFAKASGIDEGRKKVEVGILSRLI